MTKHREVLSGMAKKVSNCIRELGLRTPEGESIAEQFPAFKLLMKDINTMIEVEMDELLDETVEEILTASQEKGEDPPKN